MSWNPTVVGLALDVVGFILVFAFGGFEFGRSVLLLEDSKSKNVFKFLGAFLIIVGFGLQIVGAIGA